MSQNGRPYPSKIRIAPPWKHRPFSRKSDFGRDLQGLGGQQSQRQCGLRGGTYGPASPCRVLVKDGVRIWQPHETWQWPQGAELVNAD